MDICSADIRRLLRKTITLSSPCKVWFLPQKTCLALPQKIQFPSSSLFPLFHQFLSDLIQWHILCRCVHNIYFGFYIKSVLSELSCFLWFLLQKVSHLLSPTRAVCQYPRGKSISAYITITITTTITWARSLFFLPGPSLYPSLSKTFLLKPEIFRGMSMYAFKVKY